MQGDKVELQQVVLNLLLNAFEAMKDCPASQREINVRAALTGGRGAWWCTTAGRG